LLERSGAALVIQDRDLTGDVLADAILLLVFDRERTGTMSRASRDLGKPDAARNIGGHLRELTKRSGRLRRLATLLGDICSAR
jgi:UDP-N-acetylglucosamine--N-acetylmuramyl-(pentapeptide) pyrophosphoryl-undecaprenol N-acetylglucosamine transferase